MKSVGFALVRVAGPVAALVMVPSCGGKTQDDGTPTVSSAGAGGQLAGSGGARGNVITGGAAGTAGASTSGDTGSSLDVLPCNAASASKWAQLLPCVRDGCCNVSDAEGFTSRDVTNCTLQLRDSPQEPKDTELIVACSTVVPQSSWTLDAGALVDDTGWNIDYSFNPARVQLGVALCGQLRALDLEPIYVITLHSPAYC